MAIVKIDSWNTEPLQALLARLANILGVTPDTPVAVFVDAIGEFGRQEDFVAFARPLEPLADQILVVHVPFVKEC